MYLPPANSLILKFTVKFRTWQILVSSSFQRRAFTVKVADVIKPSQDAAAKFDEKFPRASGSCIRERQFYFYYYFITNSNSERYTIEFVKRCL